MAMRIIGQCFRPADRDQEGHRTYKLATTVEGDYGEGPAIALQTPGLPLPGDVWNFGVAGILNDRDDWATCKQGAIITPMAQGEPNRTFMIEQTFSTKGDEKRCKDQQIEDPLLVPNQVSGGFTKYQVEAVTDRSEDPITNSSFERIRGPQVEFDASRQSIRIEQNVPDLQWPLLCAMADTLNDRTIWGIPRRCIKFTPGPWSKKYWGQCSVYYTRSLDFEVWIKKDNTTGGYVSGWDRDILDEGTKALNGHWDLTPGQEGKWKIDKIGTGPTAIDADPGNPAHFIRILDPRGNPMTVPLNGKGVPVDSKVLGYITGATGGSALVLVTITAPAHGLTTGDIVSIAQVEMNDIVGPTPAVFNGTWKVTVTSPSTFTLDQSLGVNGGGTYTYKSGGYWSKLGVGQGNIHVEKYEESNFLLLNVPTSI